jgi:hypothetical protein
MKRIADRLAAGEQITPAAEVESTAAAALTAAWRDAARSLPRVAADAVSRWYWTSSQEWWDLAEHFGPLRLPFDRLWVEHTIPARSWTADHGWTNSPIAAMACLLRGRDPERDAPSDAAQEVTTAYVLATQRHLVVPTFSERFFVDAGGRYLCPHQIAAGREFTPESAKGAPFRDVAMLSIGLMHCRNVRLEEVQPPDSKSHRRRRRQQPRLKFSRIALPSTLTSATDRATAGRAAGEPLPHHLVRGHFKTYTSEAPLFGKRVGTYFWGWHARGDHAGGERVHEYDVVR